jgi:predicted Zn finger-like uncharacterized protein
MEFSCDRCATRYSVPDEKVRGKRVRTKCRKCGAEIIVTGAPLPSGATRPVSVPVPVPAKAAALAPRLATPVPGPLTPSSNDERWTVAVGRTEQRKMTTAEIVDECARGTLGAGVLIWKAGMERWQPPREVPAVALALASRESVAPRSNDVAKPPPSKAPLGQASDWDSDEATRVVDSSLKFPGRLLRGSDPPAPSRQVTKPAAASSEETTRVAASNAPPKLESTMRTDAQALVNAAFDFEDEATAVIAPDRARELLEAEAAKAPAPALAPPTASDFDFDDEATEVLAPERAEALLVAQTHVPSVAPTVPSVESPRVSPIAVATQEFHGSLAENKAAPANEPSIVVAQDSSPKASPKPEAPRTPEAPRAPKTPVAAPPPKPVAPKPALARDLAGIQNEATRVVRVRKAGAGGAFWVMLIIALGAAAAGGFIASEMFGRHAGTRGLTKP